MTASLSGTISFINHEKGYATIDYLVNGKKKTINGNIGEKEQLKLKAEKVIKKIHQFHVGDEVSFILAQSPRGDRMIADKIVFRFNNSLDNIRNKAAVDNKFVGYLKKVGDDYFVKETGSYIFFPLILSPWEEKPNDNSLNDPIFFSLNNADKPGKMTASLLRSKYIPEYLTAKKYFEKKSVIDSTVYKITPHGIFVNVVGDKVQAKIPVEKADEESKTGNDLKVGDTVKVIITYLGHAKIIVERR
jgi:ribosomal protein S1